MLIGQSELSFDVAGRLALPDKYCDAFRDGVVLTAGFDNNLLLFPNHVFQGILEHLRLLNITDSGARDLARFLLGNAFELALDENRCLDIPQQLLQIAGIASDVVLLGQGEYSELWATMVWNEKSKELCSSGANESRFSHLFIAMG